MKTLLSLYLPTFACDLVRRRQGLPPNLSILLSASDHQREVVAACCLHSIRAGVEIGMTLAHARALLPPATTHVETLDLQATARRLRALGNWCLRFVPTVALDEPNGLFLDASGCERLYGNLSRLMQQLASALRTLRLSARLVAAPTWGAAWALARYGDKPTEIVVVDDLPARLSPLPPVALRLEVETLDRLHQVGIDRIAHLLKMPRASLAERYGAALLTRLDQAFGMAPETIEPIVWHTLIVEEFLLDGPTDRLGDLMQLIRQMLSRIVKQLVSRDSGCRAIELTLIRSDLEPLILRVSTARPTCDARHLWKLLEPKIDRAHLGFGVEGLRLTAQSIARLVRRQSDLWNQKQEQEDDEALSRLVDTLGARLGPRRVLQMVPREAHLPEHSFAYRSTTNLNASCTAALIEADRPSLVLPTLREAQVMFLVPHGPVARIRSGRIDDAVMRCIGPERIFTEWWQGQAATRDYYKIETEMGRWLWLFRDLTSGRWFVQGEWA